MKISVQALLRNKLFFLLLLLIPVITHAKVSEQPESIGKFQDQIVKQGVMIKLSIDPVLTGNTKPVQLREGENARLQFKVNDAETQQPIKGLHPSAWIDRKNPKEKDLSCKDRVNSFVQGKLAFQPEANLNAYYVLSLNDKASISVIDPLGGYGTSKIITRVFLESPGIDWVLSGDHKKLYVATPLSKQVAVINTATWKVDAYLPFSSAPTRLALQSDQKYLWVGLETPLDKKSFSGVSIIDTETLEPAALISTGKGHHELAFSDDDQYAFISNDENHSLTVIDIEKLSKVNEIKFETKPSSISFSALSKALYLATEKGDVVVFDVASQNITTRINTGSSLKTIRFTADGRWGFAVSQKHNKVFIIDASVNRVVHTLDVGDAPDQVTFTDTYAYIRSTAKEDVSMILLDGLGKKASIPLTTFPGGQTAPNKMPAMLISDAVVPTPEGNAVVVANPVDKTIYYYMEGMSAPMGNFKLFGRNPMAVMVVDRSLEETAPGKYTGVVEMPPHGPYIVAVLLDSPAVYHCFSTEIAPNPELAKKGPQPVKIKYLVDNNQIQVGKTVQIDLKVTDFTSNKSKSDVRDLQVLTFRIPGSWQKRIMATALSDGIYRFEFTPPTKGIYQIHLQSPSLKVNFEQSPSLILHANNNAPSDPEVKDKTP